MNNINIYCGDCLVKLDELIKSGVKVSLVVTDPPYKIVQGGCTNQKTPFFKGANMDDIRKGKIFNKNNIKFSDWLPKVYEILEDDKHCYVMCNDRNLKELLVEGEKAGFKLLNILVWGKSKHSPNRYYLKNCEFIAMFRKGRALNINNMGTKQLLLINNVENKVHPTEKPLDLLKILIENSTQEGELVLDPFMGSGVTGEACGVLGRRFIGMEIDEAYYKYVSERLICFSND